MTAIEDFTVGAWMPCSGYVGCTAYPTHAGSEYFEYFFRVSSLFWVLCFHDINTFFFAKCFLNICSVLILIKYVIDSRRSGFPRKAKLACSYPVGVYWASQYLLQRIRFTPYKNYFIENTRSENLQHWTHHASNCHSLQEKTKAFRKLERKKFWKKFRNNANILWLVPINRFSYVLILITRSSFLVLYNTDVTVFVIVIGYFGQILSTALTR